MELATDTPKPAVIMDQLVVADFESVTAFGFRSDNPRGTYSEDVLVTFTANYQ